MRVGLIVRRCGAADRLRLWPEPEPDTFRFETGLRRQGHRVVAGLDEAGRGPLAGPVVAACVVLPPDCDYREFVDSKSVGEGRRLAIYEKVMAQALMVSHALVTEGEIDRINILRASLLAMRQAVEKLAQRPDFLLVDGNQAVPIAIPQRTLVKGESRSASIAAASIVAKVTRDRLMEEYHQRFPAYDFRRNKGYGTAAHRLSIQEHGPCPIHRRTFRGVRDYLD